jgi:hypothetical protein
LEQHAENHGSGTMQISEAMESSQSLVSTPKKRSQADKKGRHRYTLELQHEILDRIETIEKTQQLIIDGLQIAEYLKYTKPYVEKVICKDEIDKAILRVLFEAGRRGILPKDIVNQIRDPKLWDRWQIFHRIEHMNKRFEARTKLKVAEKVGHEWRLTQFAYDAYESTKEEFEKGEEVTTSTPGLESS